MARGYQNYRGRHSAGTRAAIALLVLILIAACAFIFAQQYISYADDGRIYLELPYFGRVYLPTPPPPPPEPETDAEPEPPPVQLIIDEPETPPEPEPEPEPVDLFGDHRLAELSVLPAGSPALTELLAEKGANGFVYPVRNNKGEIFWASPTGQKKAVKVDEAATEQLRGLCGTEDVWAVARFNVLHDSYYAFANMKDAAICQANGYVWYDNHSWHWLEPEKEVARQYVTGLAAECAQLGFDELLLEELCYPTRGNTYKISYKDNAMEKKDALALVLSDLRTALEPYGTKLSLLLTEEQILEGTSEESGVDLAALLPLVDGVYVQASDPEAVRAALAAPPGAEKWPELVLISPEPGDAENWCIPAG